MLCLCVVCVWYLFYLFDPDLDALLDQPQVLAAVRHGHTIRLRLDLVQVVRLARF